MEETITLKIFYKDFTIKIIPADPDDENNGKYLWEIWGDYGCGDECIGGHHGYMEGYDLETAIRLAKEEVDDEKFQSDLKK